MALKQEAIALMEGVPEDQAEFFRKIIDGAKKLIASNCEEERKKEIFARLDKLMEKEPPLTNEQIEQGRKNAEQFNKCVEEIQKIMGDENGWENEEEMLKELMEDRRKIKERMRV